MTAQVVHDEEVIYVNKRWQVEWSARTWVSVEPDGYTTIHQEVPGTQQQDWIALPPEYIPGIIKALEKALEKP